MSFKLYTSLIDKRVHNTQSIRDTTYYVTIVIYSDSSRRYSFNNNMLHTTQRMPMIFLSITTSYLELHYQILFIDL